MTKSLKKLRSSVGETGRIVIRNTLFSMGSSVIGQLIALLSSLVMGRILGVQGLGSYTFAITFSGIVYLFLNLGLGSIFQRNISQNRNSAEKNYANALSIRLFFSLPLSLLIAVIGAFVMNKQADVLMLVLACLYTGLTGVFTLIENGITAVEKFQISFFFNLLQKLLCFIMTFLALYFSRNMLTMLVLHNIVFALLILTQLIYVNHSICRIHLEYDKEFCIKLLKESFPTIFGAAAEYLSLKSDIFVLTLMLGEVSTGLYSVSSNVYIAASFVPLAMAKAATPTFNRMIACKQNVVSLVKKTFGMMLLSSLILIVGIFLIGRFGIVLLWGKDFELATTSLKILSISLLFMPANRFLEYMLVGMKKQVLVAKCSMIGATFNIVANIILVPRIGMNAVAITTIITEFIVMIIEFFFFYKKRKVLVDGLDS